MWTSERRHLPPWIEDAYDLLAPRIRDRDGGMPRADAETVLTDRGDLDLNAPDARYALAQLLDRGYLYEVGDTLFVTDADR